MSASSTKSANTVFYHIYPLQRGDIEKLHLDCLTAISDYIDIIWNAEGFTLNTELLPTPHLTGQLWFDNSIEDEWYTVWLLKRITTELPVICSVWDDDGQFVFIEAADVLPSWITPDNSSNRLFLFGGSFVFIPQPQNPAEITTFPQNNVTLSQAINCIHLIDPKTGYSASINKAIAKKLDSFPKRSQHKIKCHLPVSLIHGLHAKPGLISTLISLYMYSDSREKQQVIKNRKLSWTKVEPTNVLLTRCQYAQLYSQRIFTTHGWDHVPVGHKEHDSKQLGLKITVGAELALSIASGETASDTEFTKYIKKLESFGYFANNIEGSKAYSELFSKAEVFYSSSQKQDTGSIWMERSCMLKKYVNENFDEQQYVTAEVVESESDSWMDVIPEDIEKWFLKGRMSDKNPHEHKKSKPTKNTNSVEELPTDNLATEINTKINSFIGKISSFEGAEVPEESPELNVDDFINCLKEFKDHIDKEANKESDSEDTSSISPESEEEMSEYMRELEEQLEATTLGDTFEKDTEGDIDIDLNLVSNILQSFSADSGLSGPAASVLASLGVHLPRDDEQANGS